MLVNRWDLAPASESRGGSDGHELRPLFPLVLPWGFSQKPEIFPETSGFFLNMRFCWTLVCKDPVCKDPVCKDPVCKDPVCKDPVCKDPVCKD